MTWKLVLLILFFSVSAYMLGYLRQTQATPDHGTPTFREGESSVTFIGHATALVHTDGINILTDPNFNGWTTIARRYRAPGLKPENLPRIDAIVISHTHRDHLDEWTLKQLPKDIPVLISSGNGDYLREWGFQKVVEMEPWDTLTISGVRITATPAQHSGARNTPRADYPKALGYIIEGNKTFYFAGDTGFFEGFSEIGKRAKIDVALLPIGAYIPRWFMKTHHMDPEDSLKAMEALGAKEMVPIHWGSFRMALDGPDEAKEVLAGLLENSSLKSRVRILENGEKYELN